MVHNKRMKGFEIKNQAGKASIKLIGSISWWRNNSDDFIRQVDDLLSRGFVDLDGYLNTPGGDMIIANEIGNQIARFTGKKTCKLGALCASAGTIVSTYFDTVEASANTQYMIHDPSVQPIIEHLSDFDSNRALYENLLNDALERYHAKTGIAIPELTTMLKNTTWMNAKVAKEKGFVDSISTDKAEMPTDAATLLDKYKVPDNIKYIITNSITQNVDMKQIALKLGLPENATEAEILAAIDRQKVASEGATENGIKLLVAMAEKKGFTKERITALAKADFENTLALVSDAPEKTAVVTTIENTQAEGLKPEATRLTDFLDAFKDMVGNGGSKPEAMSFTQMLEKDKAGLVASLNSNPNKVQKMYEAEFKFLPTVEDLKANIR